MVCWSSRTQDCEVLMYFTLRHPCCPGTYPMMDVIFFCESPEAEAAGLCSEGLNAKKSVKIEHLVEEKIRRVMDKISSKTPLFKNNRASRE